MRLRLASLLLLASSAFSAHAAITGVVMDRDGKPIAGVRVAAYPLEARDAFVKRLQSSEPQRKPVVETKTDTKGVFLVENVKENAVRVEFAANGFAPAGMLAERDDDLGALVLRPAADRRGTVKAGGKPVAGAVVIGSNGFLEVVTHTDDAGRFTLPDPKTWMNRLTIVHPDFAIADETAGFDRSWKSLDRILARGETVAGRVYAADGKTPVAGAALSIDGWLAGTSAEDGSFSIAHSPSAWKLVEARTNDSLGSFARGSKGSPVIRLAPASSVSGVVIDAKSRLPIAGALVELVQGGSPMMLLGRATTASAITDEKGAFSMTSRPGSYALRAEHPGFRTRGTADVMLAAGKRVERSLTAMKVARVSGVVQFDDKVPVAAGTLSLRTTSNDRMRMAMGANGPADGYTAPDGHFTLKVSPEEEFELASRQRAYPEGISARFRLEPGEKKSGLNIVVPRGLEVTGRVIDEKSRPVAGVTVTPSEAEGSTPGMMMIRRRMSDVRADDLAVETNDEGTFVLRLKETAYDLVFRREGFAPANVRGVKVSPRVAPIEVTLKPGVEVSGRVTRGANGIDGVTVAAISQAGGDSVATTDPSGYFTLRDLAEGQYMLLTNKPEEDIRDNRSITAPARDIRIDLPVGGRIEGRVVDKTTGAPVTAFRAGLSGVRGGGGMSVVTPGTSKEFTNPDGTFVLENVEPGSVEVVVQAAGYVRARMPGVLVEDGKTAPAIEVKLDTGSRITGKVTTTSGAAVPDAQVSVAVNQRRPGGGFVMPGEANSATTGSDGQYTIEAVENGTIDLIVSHPKYVQTRKSVEVTEREVRADFRLETGMKVSGQVVTEAGAPVPDATVAASSAAGSAGFSTTRADANGNFSFDTLPSGRYTFNASKSGLNNGVLRDIEINSHGPVRIVMSAGAVIYGRVSGLSESDAATAEVFAMGAGSRTSAPVDRSGAFRIDGAPTGSVQVNASAGGFNSRRSTAAKTVNVEPGESAQVDLEFRSDVVITGRVTKSSVAVPNARVIFIPESRSRSAADSMTSTDASGNYSITGLEDGFYTVNVIQESTFNSVSKKYEVRGSGRFDVEMPTTSLHGRVVDASTGSPISGASVEVRPAEQARMIISMSATTDANGSFNLASIGEGRYRVTASMTGYGASATDAVVTSGDGEVEVKLSKSDGLRLRLVDGRSNRPISGRISFSDVQDQFVTSEFLRAQEGEMQRVSIAVGQYLARVSADGYAAVSFNVTAPGELTIPLTPGGTLEIVSRKSNTLTGRLMDGSGRSYLIAGRVGIFAIDPSPAVTTLQPIASGSYMLQIIDSSGNVVNTKPVNIGEGQTARVEVQ